MPTSPASLLGLLAATLDAPASSAQPVADEGAWARALFESCPVSFLFCDGTWDDLGAVERGYWRETASAIRPIVAQAVAEEREAGAAALETLAAKVFRKTLDAEGDYRNGLRDGVAALRARGRA